MPVVKYKDGSEWKAIGGGGSGASESITGYAFSSSKTFTDEDKANLKKVCSNQNIYMTIDRLSVIRTMSMGSKWGFVVINTNGATSNQVLVYTVNINNGGDITSDNFTLFLSYYLVGNNSSTTGDIITSDNYNNYVGWIMANGASDSNLANAKELFILWDENSSLGYIPQYYNFSTALDDDSTSTLLDYSNYPFQVDYSGGTTTWVYNGSDITIPNLSIKKIYYKT